MVTKIYSLLTLAVLISSVSCSTTSQALGNIFGGGVNPLAAVGQAITDGFLAPVRAVTDSLNIVGMDEAVQFFCTSPTRGRIWQRVYVGDQYIDSKVDQALPTGLLIHGWYENGEAGYLYEVGSDWVWQRDYNVCRVNWGRLSRYDYAWTVGLYSRLVAGYITAFIVNMGVLTTWKMQPSTFTLVGHDIGAHIAGYIGQFLVGQIHMIIGLSPPGLWYTYFVYMDKDNRLDITDAHHVQVVHTSDWMIGVNYVQGHQDFYVNHGLWFSQPMCFWPFLKQSYYWDPIRCAHYRSISLFKHSLNPGAASLCKGVRCANGFAYTFRSCYNEYNTLGLDSSR